MTFVILDSTCIDRVGYSPATRRMIVEFVHSQKEYDLHDVPEHHFHGLINADSPGRYWNEYLKGNY
jgi:hypothetical protein